MNKSSNSDRRTTQRAAGLKQIAYFPAGSRKRANSATDQTTGKKRKTRQSGSSKSSSSNNPERNTRSYQAPDILSDSGDERPEDTSSSTVGQRRRTTTNTEAFEPSSKAKASNTDASNKQRHDDDHTDMDKSDGSSDDNEDEEPDDGVTDLQALNHDALKSTLASEQPRWNDHRRSKACHPNPHDSDESDDHALPNANRHSTVASHIGSRFNDCRNDDDSTEDDRRSRKSKGSVGKPKPSKREQNRRDEVPQWANSEASAKSVARTRIVLSDDSDGNSADSEADAAHKMTRPQHGRVNEGWLPEAHFTPPKRGSRIISLKDQPAPLKKTLRRAIHEAIGDVLFDNAFPSIDENYKYHRKLLRSCARDLKYDHLVERFSRDVEFGVAMARLLQQRISNLRGLFKSKARSRVEAAFLLIPNDPATILKIENLTQRTHYIFKPNNNGAGYDKLAPFQHPSIIAILQDVVFKGSRGSALSEKHAAKFTTIPANGHQPKRRMLSEAMVCMAATAIHAVLDDWRSGREIPSDFNADLYSGVYLSHMEFMKYTREGNPAGYRYMMAKIYDDCSAVTAGNIAVSNKAMELLDLHNMPVE